MNVYYSHTKLLRGTRQETEDIRHLESLGFTVDNPYDIKYMECWEEEGISFGKTLIEKNDGFVFRALPDGSIPVGVGKEVAWAKALGKPVIEMPFDISHRLRNMDETLEFFKESGK